MAVRTSLLVLAGLLVAPVALAGPPPPKAAHGTPVHPAGHPAAAHAASGKTAKLNPIAHREKAPAPSRSIGSPTAGKLANGAHLAESDHVRVVPSYAPGDSRYGLESLVSMLDRAGRTVHKQFPDAQLSVGHLSRPGGGEIDRHASHESGRDADIGFFVRNQTGKTIYADHFVAFKGDGTAPSWPGAQFDDAKNWQLVTSFVSDANAHVTHIFVASPIRARLLAYAAKIGAPQNIQNLAATLMAQPRGSLPHDDHFHVRVACPSGSTELAHDKCVEIPLPHHRSSTSHSALANTHNAKPKPAAPSKPAPAPPPAKPEPKSEDAETKNDFIPSLAPSIPGLDAAVIPKKIPGSEQAKDEPGKPDTLEPLPPIDDPDGVFESR